MIAATKKQLSIAELDSQAAFQLPAREMLSLITVVITDLSILNNNTVTLTVQNNQVAVQVCAAVSAISTQFGLNLTCTASKG